MMTTRLVVVTLSSVSRKVFSAFLCPFLQDIALLWLMKVCGSISLDNTIFILNFFQQDSPLHKCHLGFCYALENQFWIQGHSKSQGGICEGVNPVERNSG
jgi:hypothetical protein